MKKKLFELLIVITFTLMIICVLIYSFVGEQYGLIISEIKSISAGGALYLYILLIIQVILYVCYKLGRKVKTKLSNM